MVLTGKVSNLRQAGNRLLLFDALRDGRLIQEIVVDLSGYFRIEFIEWDKYWSQALDFVPDLVRSGVNLLHTAWQDYCQSGYVQALAALYCYRYFELLRLSLIGNINQKFLCLLASFEVFSIRRFHALGAEAAGIISLRHPAYLLAKIRKPNAPDDPKNLPLVCLPPSAASPEGGGLYYHYRQMKFDSRYNASAFTYPAVALGRRLDSFGCIDVFSSALRSTPDPHGRQRAAAIADCAVGPFLKRRGPATEKIWRGEIGFADIGGGTGILLSHLCKHLLRHFPDALNSRSFAWSIIDLSARDPARHTAGHWLRPNLSMVEYIQADYKSWVLQESAKSSSPPWDVALMCRILNNMSHFSIEFTNKSNEISVLSDNQYQHFTPSFLPCRCLEVGTPELLVASNSKAYLRSGSSFQQLSLTDYFQILYLACHNSNFARSCEYVFFPLRQLRHDALRLNNGSCLLEQLTAIADVAVIEDVDMSADQLYDYLTLSKPAELAASDATDRRRMVLSNLLCLSHRKHAALLPGERLW